ncbi:alpha-(1-2)-phosphatidylinositol mannosyltransferase [Nocardiopsis gilva YIM 90087]|uniref:Alpha-(1-2)-phosphatidylinositol mannosyltransferase n=2 Tax=Nocardiopsis gilva TaxID=280236 RepID=A0A223S6F2_9ACTN|nr:glycosyltransferase family 4 protein [Nocardiopsis gilva]ASU83713.1 alpha-(1-2)-phosphatidylinositol mannosyltransferase [Nocardiopsis gilva YIM 90087]
MPPRTLLITNDFPPRRGGIETFCYELARRMPGAEGGGVVVYTSCTDGLEEAERDFDRRQPFPVVRDSSHMLLPTRRVAHRAAGLLERYGCERVLIGSAAPLGLLAGGLRDAGARRIIAMSHGHEVWWARVPGARLALRRIGEKVDVLTYLGDFTRDEIGRALRSTDRERMARLTPGVDPRAFTAGGDGTPVREKYGLGDGPVILCACRLVPRKGVDTLIRAMSWVRRWLPDARLVVVGQGPDERRLRELAAWTGVSDEVVFAGSHGHDEMPSFYAAANVFAMPCRTRKAGLEAEGLGIVYLEAAASGLPALVGSSGGAPDTVRHGETGFVVDGREPRSVANKLHRLLSAPDQAQAMGQRGREMVAKEWTWDLTAQRLEELFRAA